MPSVPHTKRILIVTGEASGDLHAANLIRAARELAPGLSFFGVTGERMRAAGCETLLPAEQIAVIGLVEVLRHLPTIWRAFKTVTATFNGPQRPDLLVLVDFPGFNMRLAKAAKRAGIPVLYYITPKVWAWRQGRAKKLARVVDRLAVIFPFEPEFYRPYNVPTDYVGNPLLDEFADYQQRQVTPRPYIRADRRMVGLFPGSRRSEIHYNFDTLLQAAERLHRQRPEIGFLMPLAISLDRSDIERRIAESGLPIELIADDIYGVAASCDVVLAVSGTVTLQVALAGTPLAVLYRAAALTFAVAMRVVKIEFISLVNIVAERQVVRELLQDAATPEALAAEALRLLEDTAYRAQVCSGLAEVREKLGESGCSGRVAKIMLDMVATRAGRHV